MDNLSMDLFTDLKNNSLQYDSELSNKIMKSIINANYLSPWSDDIDIDMFLAPPPQPPLKNNSKENQQAQQRMQEEAKKTLLGIDSDKKRMGKSQIKQYLYRKNKNQFSNMSVKEKEDFKLPPILKPYDSIDYSAQELFPSGGKIEPVDVFRKYGSHRRSKLHEGNKVQRSISYGPFGSIREGDKKQKVQTLQPIPMNNQEQGLKPLKLKGKKYSFDLRVQSERKLSSDQYKYIPSQPNITPHYLLFGHSKQDILKKVLQQINQKIK